MLSVKHREVVLFVVYIAVDDGRTDFKAFERKPDAENRFRAASVQVWDGDLKSAALFDVSGTNDPREALDAINARDESRVTLLAKEPDLPDIDIDLSKLGL